MEGEVSEGDRVIVGIVPGTGGGRFQTGHVPSATQAFLTRLADMPSSHDPIIALSGIEKTYLSGDNSVYALRGVSLEIFSGDFVAIIGSSGSGKSTLMNVLGLLDTQDSGSYIFEGKETLDMSEDGISELRGKRIGFVFPEFQPASALHCAGECGTSASIRQIAFVEEAEEGRGDA